jgi:hypothetical protein
MPLTNKQYEELGSTLNGVFNDTPANEDLHVGRAAVEESWAVIRSILVAAYVGRGMEQAVAEVALDNIAPQFLPEEWTREEIVGDILRRHGVQVADPDALAVELVTALKTGDDDDEEE